MLMIARVGVRKGATHGDDVVQSWHLQLEVGVVGDHHELGLAWPPQDGVVGPQKVHHLEDQDLRAKVGSIAKCDGQVNLLEWVRLCPWDHAMEGRARWAEFGSRDVHGVEGVDVEDVEAAASIYQHLDEVLLADDGVNDEQLTSWSHDMGGMVPLIEGDQRF